MKAEAMTCDGCGLALIRRPDGAWPACCSRAYWVNLEPLPRDREWIVATGTAHDGGLWRYGR